MLRNNLNISSEKEKRDFARHLRTRQTNGERALWRKIRAKRFHGIKFRRQVPIGPYIVDFLYIQKKLIIEIDGDSHYEPGAKEKDAIREAYLREMGFDRDCAVSSLRYKLIPPPHPSPAGGGRPVLQGPITGSVLAPKSLTFWLYIEQNPPPVVYIFTHLEIITNEQYKSV